MARPYTRRTSLPSRADIEAHTSVVGADDYERSRVIADDLLSARSPDWKKAFDDDVDLLGRVIRDILKLGGPASGGAGRRVAPEPTPETISQLRQLMGEDYSLLTFDETLSILAFGMANTTLANKVALSESQVGRLRRGTLPPSLLHVTQIAKAFGKHPSFFLEYRIAYVAAAIAERLGALPDASVSLYRKLSKSESPRPRAK